MTAAIYDVRVADCQPKHREHDDELVAHRVRLSPRSEVVEVVDGIASHPMFARLGKTDAEVTAAIVASEKKRMPYIENGFPFDCWLPIEAVRQWKGGDYPAHNTNESVQAWRHGRFESAAQMSQVQDLKLLRLCVENFANDDALIRNLARR